MNNVKLVEDAYRRIGLNSINEDAIQNIVVDLIEKIKHGEIDQSRFEFQNIQNMTIYIRGAAKKNMIKVSQSNDHESLSDILDHPATPEYNHIRELIFKALKGVKYNIKNKGGTKTAIPAFDFFESYYIDDIGLKEIAIQYGTVKTHLQYYKAKLDSRLSSLPIKGLLDDRFISQENVYKDQGFGWSPEKDISEFVVNLWALRKYRRTKEELDLERFRDNSFQIRVKHDKKIESSCWNKGKQGNAPDIKPLPPEYGRYFVQRDYNHKIDSGVSDISGLSNMMQLHIGISARPKLSINPIVKRSQKRINQLLNHLGTGSGIEINLKKYGVNIYMPYKSAVSKLDIVNPFKAFTTKQVASCFGMCPFLTI